jgi:hypothetical protein
MRVSVHSDVSVERSDKFTGPSADGDVYRRLPLASRFSGYRMAVNLVPADRHCA